MKPPNDQAQLSDMAMRQVFDASPIGVAILERATGRRLYANAALASIFSAANANELLDSSISETWADPDDLEQAMSVFQSGENLVNLETRRRRSDGSLCWVLMNTQPLVFEGIEAGIVWHIDITERKRAEERSKESEQSYKKIFDFSPFAVYIQDGKTILDANAAAARIYGYDSPAAMVGIHVIDLIHPDDRGQYLERLERHQEKAEQLPFIEERRIRRDGAVINVIQSGTRIPLHGRDLILAISQDITDQKLTEHRLKDAVESIAEGLVLFGTDDRVVMWNHRFAEMYPELEGMLPDHPTAEDMFRTRFHAGAVGSFDIPIEDYVEWRMRMRRNQGGTPATHRHQDGRWFRTTERATTEGGIVAISADVTELKDRELELTAALDKAELADRSKSMFLATMSHESRTPLNAISGFSEIMKLGLFGPLGNPDYLGYAGDIYASAQHLLAIINDILDLSRITEGEDDLSASDIAIADVIQDCLPLVRERALEAQVEIVVDVSDELPRILVDVRRMKQVLINLLSNALKFSEKGSEVTITASVTEDGGMEIKVVDRGIGMRPEDIPKALEPFGQIDSSLARKYEGTGLGLSLVKQLVEAHGGQLHIESSLGAGTAVRILLPSDRLVRPKGHGRQDSIES